MYTNASLASTLQTLHMHTHPCTVQYTSTRLAPCMHTPSRDKDSLRGKAIIFLLHTETEDVISSIALTCTVNKLDNFNRMHTWDGLVGVAKKKKTWISYINLSSQASGQSRMHLQYTPHNTHKFTYKRTLPNKQGLFQDEPTHLKQLPLPVVRSYATCSPYYVIQVATEYSQITTDSRVPQWALIKKKPNPNPNPI